MKFALRAALFGLLLAASAAASAQRSVFVTSLPEGVDSRQALEVARQVLTANGWTIVPADNTSIGAEKQRSGLRVYVADRALRFSDQSLRSKGVRQREHRDEGPQLTAVPQAELDALRADLRAAFAQKLPLAEGKPLSEPSQVLFASIPSGLDAERVMSVTRGVLTRRHWHVSDGEGGALVARIRNVDNDSESTLRVFLADGTLRFTDRSTDRKGRPAQVPERWLTYIRADLRQAMSTAARAPIEREPAARQSAPKDSDPGERLRRLKALLDGGLITQAEYDAKRAEILKGL